MSERRFNMADDLGKRGPQDRLRINVNETWERKWWSQRLGVTPDKLKAAVRKVGPMVSDVRRLLKRRPGKT
jgi:hypothetical protein